MQVQVDREIPQHIVDTIAKDGYHLEVVSPEDSDEPYVFYTVGRTAQKKPEVIFFDYRKDVGETLIKEYVTRQIDAIVPNWQNSSSRNLARRHVCVLVASQSRAVCACSIT